MSTKIYMIVLNEKGGSDFGSSEESIGECLVDMPKAEYLTGALLVNRAVMEEKEGNFFLG